MVRLIENFTQKFFQLYFFIVPTAKIIIIREVFPFGIPRDDQKEAQELLQHPHNLLFKAIPKPETKKSSHIYTEELAQLSL